MILGSSRLRWVLAEVLFFFDILESAVRIGTVWLALVHRFRPRNYTIFSAQDTRSLAFDRCRNRAMALHRSSSSQTPKPARFSLLFVYIEGYGRPDLFLQTRWSFNVHISSLLCNYPTHARQVSIDYR